MRSLVRSIQVTRGSSQQEEESGNAQSEDYQKIIVEVSWDSGGRRERREGELLIRTDLSQHNNTLSLHLSARLDLTVCQVPARLC